jgi:hypothetical protein
MMRIGRILPGELEGNINPEDYGIQVIKEEEPSGEEAAQRISEIYEGAKERSGVADPKLEKYLGELASGQVVHTARRPRRRGLRLRFREVSDSSAGAR